MISIVEQVFANAGAWPEKIAVTDGKRSLTYSKLCGQILMAKRILSSQYGIQKGDAVVIAANKQLSFVAVYFACHLLGAITLPLAPDVNPVRLSLIVSRTDPKLSVGLEVPSANCRTASLTEFDTADENVSTEGMTFSADEDEDIVFSADEAKDIVFPAEEDVADIIFTTGTTGEPKGVTLSQKNIAAAARNINGFIQNQAEDVEMLALPVSHSFGLGRLRCALSNGQTTVLLGSFANVKRFFRFMEEFHVTGFGMVPASWALLKKLSELKIAEYAKQLRYIEIGSAPMPLSEKLILCENLPDTRICMHYGLTEASRSAFMEFHESIDHLDTIGKETPGMMIVIMDENGTEVADGQEGEICVSGDAVTKGYYHLPEVNAVSFWGEFFRTGDWGVKTTDGRIKLCSRKKELINVGGKKVSPIEVEEVLLKLDFVKECVCVGAPDPDGVLGEVVKAFLVTEKDVIPDRDEISREIAPFLEDYKLPVQYEVIDSIPKTTSGKVQRLLLKK